MNDKDKTSDVSVFPNKTEAELLTYGKELKDWLLSEIYEISVELDWTMLPKTMTKDFLKKDVLKWCLTSGAFRRAQKPEIFKKFSSKVSRMVDLLRSEGYQKQTRDREVADLKSLHANGCHIQPQLKQYTEKEIDGYRQDITKQFPFCDTLKEMLTILQEIYLIHPNATIKHEYDYSYIVIGKESFEDAKDRLNKEAKEIYTRNVDRYSTYKFLKEKYSEVTL
jgi:hypothetical protein